MNIANHGYGGLSADEVTMAFITAVSQDIVKKQKYGLPVARYDTESGQAYLENANGSRGCV